MVLSTDGQKSVLVTEPKPNPVPDDLLTATSRPEASDQMYSRSTSPPKVPTISPIGLNREEYHSPVGGSDNLLSTTSVLTATTLTYAIRAGITAGAGTRLVLQLLLDRVFKTVPFELPTIGRYSYVPSRPRALPIGNVARLLPSLEV